MITPSYTEQEDPLGNLRVNKENHVLTDQILFWPHPWEGSTDCQTPSYLSFLSVKQGGSLHRAELLRTDYAHV